jgi:hypothetical protein
MTIVDSSACRDPGSNASALAVVERASDRIE